MKRTCKQCGKEFFLSQSELNFYRSKKLAFPKRCKDCRANNKGDGSNANVELNETNKMKNAGNTQKPAKAQNINQRSNAKPHNAGKEQGDSKTHSAAHKPQNNRHQQGGKTQNDRSITYVPTYGQNVDKKSKKCLLIAVLALIALVIIAGALIIFNARNSTTDLPVMENPLVDETVTRQYTFASEKLLDEHYQKHGIEMGFASAADYEKAASDVVNNPNALTKKEAEDNDDVYYVEATNEFVVVSTRGFIRTYFKPDSGKKYYDKQ